MQSITLDVSWQFEYQSEENNISADLEAERYAGSAVELEIFVDGESKAMDTCIQQGYPTFNCSGSINYSE